MLNHEEEKVLSMTCGWLVSHHLWLSTLRRSEQQHQGFLQVTCLLPEITGGKTGALVYRLRILIHIGRAANLYLPPISFCIAF